VHYRQELGRAPDPALVRRAVDSARRAAERAAGVLAYRDAAGLYGVALDALEWGGDGQGEERGELLIELADQLALAGDVGRGRPALEKASSEAHRLDSAVLSARAALSRGELDAIDGSEFGPQSTERIRAAMAVFQRSGDALHEARAWGVLSLHDHGIGCEIAAGEAAEQMLACAQRAGSEALQAKALHRIACSLAGGPCPVADAMPRLSGMLEQTASPYVTSKVLLYLAELEAMRGRYPEARRLAEQSTTMMRELGDVRELAIGEALRCSAIELWAGDFQASEGLARSGCEILERLGASGYLSSLLVCIVEALIPQGKVDEAAKILSRAESLLSSEYDLDACERQARAQALIALSSDDPAAAERPARLAVQTAMRGDLVVEQVANWLVLADSLCAIERQSEARDAARRALAISEHKGHVLFADRARAIISMT
jgi:hypothetical protein